MELQTEMLHLDLIDAEGGIQEEEEEEEDERRQVDAVDDNHKEEQGAGLPVTQPQLKDFIPAVAMDTYRPKRPTTLNLFPQVPRTQVRWTVWAAAFGLVICVRGRLTGVRNCFTVRVMIFYTAQTRYRVIPLEGWGVFSVYMQIVGT